MGVLENTGFWWGTGALAAVYSVVAGMKLYSLLGKGRISSEEARRAIADGRIKHVIDVRTDVEWRLGHYPGAKHIPVSEIPGSKKLNSIAKSATILVYCNTGQRARRAAALLREAGYENVEYIAGGYGSIMRK